MTIEAQSNLAERLDSLLKEASAILCEECPRERALWMEMIVTGKLDKRQSPESGLADGSLQFEDCYVWPLARELTSDQQHAVKVVFMTADGRLVLHQVTTSINSPYRLVLEAEVVSTDSLSEALLEQAICGTVTLIKGC